MDKPTDTPRVVPSVMRHFSFTHLPPALQKVSKVFAEAAASVLVVCPDDEQRKVALQKLLEAKDAAVRSVVP